MKVKFTIDSKAAVDFLQKIASPETQDKLLRVTAVSALAESNARIFGEGKRSTGQLLGSYSKAYLARRQKRPYNRTSERRITLQLTGALQNDYTVGLSEPTRLKNVQGYGLGFNRDENVRKSEYIEDRYGDVFALTDAEANALEVVLQFELDRIVQ